MSGPSRATRRKGAQPRRGRQDHRSSARAAPASPVPPSDRTAMSVPSREGTTPPASQPGPRGPQGDQAQHFPPNRTSLPSRLSRVGRRLDPTRRDCQGARGTAPGSAPPRPSACPGPDSTSAGNGRPGTACGALCCRAAPRRCRSPLASRRQRHLIAGSRFGRPETPAIATIRGLRGRPARRNRAASATLRRNVSRSGCPACDR